MLFGNKLLTDNRYTSHIHPLTSALAILCTFHIYPTFIGCAIQPKGPHVAPAWKVGEPKFKRSCLCCVDVSRYMRCVRCIEGGGKVLRKGVFKTDSRELAGGKTPPHFGAEVAGGLVTLRR